MTHRRDLLWLALLMLASIGSLSCSAIGLTDELNIATCADQEPDFCESLNELSPTEDECLRWGCDDETGLCEILPTDRDHDGVAAPGCAEAGAPEDCDERDPTVYPEAPELCDGLDNDCDGVVDEGAFAVAETSLASLTDGVEVSFAQSGDGRTVAVAEGTNAGNVPTAGLFPESFDGAGVLGPLTITRPDSTKAITSSTIAATGLSNGFALALSTKSFGLGCERVIVAELIEEAEQLELSFNDGEDPTHFEEGLPNLDGEPCLPEGQQARDLVIGASNEEMLLAYLVVEAGSERPLCEGVTTTPDPASVWLNLVRRQGGAETGLARDELPMAVELTESTDNEPPAIIAVGEGRWLVAVGEASGALALYHVERFIDDEYLRSLVINQVDELTSTGRPLGEPAFALGPNPEDEESRVLTLAFRRGCRGEAALASQRYLVSGDGELEGISAQGDPITLQDAEGGDLQRPTVAYWESAQEWYVAFQRGGFELQGLRLDREGQPVDDGPFALLEVTGSGRPRIVEPSSLFSREEGGFWLLALNPGGEAPGLRALEISCEGR